MSTRAIAVFREDGETIATIYRHCDGDPAVMGEDIKNFFAQRARGMMTLDAANFVAALNSGGNDTLELYPALDFSGVDGLIRLMDDTDWAYAYLLDSIRGQLFLIVVAGREMAWSGPLDCFDWRQLTTGA